MYKYSLYKQITQIIAGYDLDIAGADNEFYIRLMANADAIEEIYEPLYGSHPQGKTLFIKLIESIVGAYQARPARLLQRDNEKRFQEHWFLSNEIAGMSLYVDRFSGNLQRLKDKLYYFKELGVNFLHLMPVFESPKGESDGGYAVSDFRKLDKRFGKLEDLQELQQAMMTDKMYLMLDIVLNHTSHHHEWAEKANAGDAKYQDYFYMYDDRAVPDQYDAAMPDIFPESAPGNFTWIEQCQKWVMTVFHNYQWDLNYTNPNVLVDMINNVFFYANLGVDILRIDAPAFIWKKTGTTCQNLPEAHDLLRLIKLCVEVATPGMALLGEAIVAPVEIMKYFGTGAFRARECDFAYNATHMAVQWDALATGDTRVMLAAQPDLLQKPYGTSWITYTRCHDDIGLGYDDQMIEQAGFQPYAHRKFIKEYYSGVYEGSPARGALFSVNPKTQDARISGSLASLCGLEAAIENDDPMEIDISLRKIILMQAHSFFLGGVPMLFYGDEAAYTNDYSYLDDEAKHYDNRWMHRPVINWDKNERRNVKGTAEHKIFAATKKLLLIRRELEMVSDLGNLEWLHPFNIHVAAYLRSWKGRQLFCVFNFSRENAYLDWQAFAQQGPAPEACFDHWRETIFEIGPAGEYLILEPYSYYLMEAK